MIERANKFNACTANPFDTCRAHIKHAIRRQKFGRFGNRQPIGKDTTLINQKLRTLSRCGMTGFNQKGISTAFYRSMLGNTDGHITF